MSRCGACNGHRAATAGMERMGKAAAGKAARMGKVVAVWATTPAMARGLKKGRRLWGLWGANTPRPVRPTPRHPPLSPTRQSRCDGDDEPRYKPRVVLL